MIKSTQILSRDLGIKAKEACHSFLVVQEQTNML